MTPRCALTIVSTLLACWPAAAPAAQAVQQAEAASGRDASLQFLAATVDAFQLVARTAQDRPFARAPDPVLRYTNPIRDIQLSDGCVYVWLHGKRPVAVASISIRNRDEVHREFTSLSEEPLVCTRDGYIVWSPTSGGLLRQPLREAPVPADTPRLRLAQLRQLAKRFAATYFKQDGTDPTESRLLPQPVYRFDEPAQRIVDGAIFAFAEANDPELLLMIEAVEGENKQIAWRYSLARMTSSPLAVRLDEQQVWTVPAFWRSPRSPHDPYIEARVTKLPEGVPFPVK